MTGEASPQPVQDGGRGAAFPLITPPLIAAAQDLLDSPPVSIFVVAAQQLAAQIVRILASAHGVVVRGSAPSLKEAVRTIGNQPPEVLFLDERIAPSDGGDQTPGALQGTDVVLIVDSPSDALVAYQRRAIDCLVTPVDREAVLRIVGRVLEHVRRHRAGMLGEKLLEFFHGAPERRTGRIPVRSAGRISFLRTEEVDWLEAQGDYVCLHAGAKKHLVRNRISVLEKQLGGSTFVRIHRSIIVNTDRIRELQPLTYGEYSVVLADGTRLTLSRSYRQHVLDLLTQVRSA